MVSYLNLQWLFTAIGLLGNQKLQVEAASTSNTGEEVRLVLFGVNSPWNTSDLTWTAVDDRVRGGSSVSHLTPSPRLQNAAIFQGTLDTKTLGGAGFASQTTKPNSDSSLSPSSSMNSSTDDLNWDLSDYDGIELRLGRFDDKTYTLVLKDTVPDSKRTDGRERSSISWEADFKPSDIPIIGEEDPLAWLPWSKFRATYRGRDKPDAAPLKLTDIRRLSFMMRSFFEKQEGDFSMEVLWFAAVKKGTPNGREPDNAEL